MATNNSNAIYMAKEMQDTGTFLFRDTIPKMCPTKAQITVAAKPGYTLTIPTSYHAKQLVPSKDWSMIKNIGKLTINIVPSPYLNGQGDPATWIVHFGSRPTFNAVGMGYPDGYLYCQTYANNGGFNSSTTSATIEFNSWYVVENGTERNDGWPTSGTNSVYLSYVCWNGDGGNSVLNGSYTHTEAAELNAGKDVTAFTSFYTTHVPRDEWDTY